MCNCKGLVHALYLICYRRILFCRRVENFCEGCNFHHARKFLTYMVKGYDERQPRNVRARDSGTDKIMMLTEVNSMTCFLRRLNYLEVIPMLGRLAVVVVTRASRDYLYTRAQVSVGIQAFHNVLCKRAHVIMQSTL